MVVFVRGRGERKDMLKDKSSASNSFLFFSYHVPVRNALAVAVDRLTRVRRVGDARERAPDDGAWESGGPQEASRSESSRRRSCCSSSCDTRRRGRSSRSGGGGLLRSELRRALAPTGLASSSSGTSSSSGAAELPCAASSGGQERRWRRVLGQAVPDPLPGQLGVEGRQVHVEPPDLGVYMVVDLLGQLGLFVRVLEDLEEGEEVVEERG